MTYDKIVFVDADGKEHAEGKIIGYHKEDNGYGDQLWPELLLEELDDIDALMDLPMTLYGTWEIRDGKVIPAGSATDSGEGDAAKI